MGGPAAVPPALDQEHPALLGHLAKIWLRKEGASWALRVLFLSRRELSVFQMTRLCFSGPLRAKQLLSELLLSLCKQQASEEGEAGNSVEHFVHG